MKVYTSRPIELKKEIETIYGLIANPNRLAPVIDKFADEAKEYQLELAEDQLSMALPAIGKVVIRRTEALPPNMVKYESVKSPVPIAVQFNLANNDDTHTLGQISLEINVPPFLSGMFGSKIEDGLAKAANMLEAIDLDRLLDGASAE